MARGSLCQPAAMRDGCSLISSRRMRHLRYPLLVAVAALVLAACGEKKETLGDATAVFGPGVQATPPPWKPEYAHLKQRIAQLKLPPVGREQVHHHSLLHVYVDGRLVPLPPNIGIDRSQNAYSSIHTHDSTGVVHMESVRPFKFTLGDFFTIWGVRFGNKSLGSLENKGADQVRVYVNGKPAPNPVDYVLRAQDNVVVGYGADGSFPHQPDARALRIVARGGKGACAKGPRGKRSKSCVAPGK